MAAKMVQNWRNRMGLGLRRVYPDIDRIVWARQRDQHTRGAREHLLAEIHGVATARPDPDRSPHLIVVVSHGPEVTNWHVAGGHHFWEINQSAIEVLGEDRVTLFVAGSDEAEQQWHSRLLRLIVETQATHIIGQIEADPNQPHNWSWDVIAAVLAEAWDGVLIGVMHDVAYEWLGHRARRMGSLMPRLLIAELCEPMDGFVSPGRFDVGPMTLPMSQATVSAIDARVRGLEKVYDVSFIGALYGYRLQLLDRLRDSGFDVAVNPHRSDVTRTEEESRSNQPTYLDYMAGLAQSKMTINFSLANGGPHEQYKIRVQEASLVGCICLTDDVDRTRHFFAPGEYGFFDSVDTLEAVVAARLADPGQLTADQARASLRAHELSRTDFWGRIDDGLRRRELQRLTGMTAPAGPAGSPSP